MPRPIFQDETWDEYNGSIEPQYELVDNRLVFLNPIMQEGTLHNSGNMNNLANTDTPISFSDTFCKITEPNSDTIIYEVTDRASGGVIVRQTVTGLDSGNLHVTDDLYDGGLLVQHREMNFNMNTMAGDVV